MTPLYSILQKEVLKLQEALNVNPKLTLFVEHAEKAGQQTFIKRRLKCQFALDLVYLPMF